MALTTRLEAIENRPPPRSVYKNCLGISPDAQGYPATGYTRTPYALHSPAPLEGKTAGVIPPTHTGPSHRNPALRLSRKTRRDCLYINFLYEN